MLTQTITVNLPDSLYRQVAQRARRTHSSLEEELLAVLASALSTTAELPTETSDALAQLAYLTDEELWQAAQVILPPEESMQMQTLMFKRQSEGLTQAEQEEAEQLLRRSEHVMLLRAQALALLHERGHNVSHLLNPPIEQ
jgi:plasmid stability protein